LLAESSISDLVEDRVYDDFYEFEDFLNQKANQAKFPAVAIETDGDEQGQKLSGHDQLNNATLTITCFHQVHSGKMRSRSKRIRDAQKTLLRKIDTLVSAIKAYLNPLAGAEISGLTIRYSHVNAITDGIFETEDNRRIITKELNFSVTYS
jgi:hypothetical protein